MAVGTRGDEFRGRLFDGNGRVGETRLRSVNIVVAMGAKTVIWDKKWEMMLLTVQFL